ncbi:Uncharacterized protein TPAR_06452, partial [Tolypocladium paradoxum]
RRAGGAAPPQCKPQPYLDRARNERCLCWDATVDSILFAPLHTQVTRRPETGVSRHGDQGHAPACAAQRAGRAAAGAERAPGEAVCGDEAAQHNVTVLQDLYPAGRQGALARSVYVSGSVLVLGEARGGRGARGDGRDDCGVGGQGWGVRQGEDEGRQGMMWWDTEVRSTAAY